MPTPLNLRTKARRAIERLRDDPRNRTNSTSSTIHRDSVNDGLPRARRFSSLHPSMKSVRQSLGLDGAMPTDDKVKSTANANTNSPRRSSTGAVSAGQGSDHWESGVPVCEDWKLVPDLEGREDEAHFAYNETNELEKSSVMRFWEFCHLQLTPSWRLVIKGQTIRSPQGRSFLKQHPRVVIKVLVNETQDWEVGYYKNQAFIQAILSPPGDGEFAIGHKHILPMLGSGASFFQDRLGQPIMEAGFGIFPWTKSVHHEYIDPRGGVLSLSEDVLRQMARELFMALAFMNSRQIIHGDVQEMCVRVGKQNGKKIFYLTQFEQSLFFGDPMGALQLWRKERSPPELIFEGEMRGFNIDTWGVGCLLFSFLAATNSDVKDKLGVHAFRSEDCKSEAAMRKRITEEIVPALKLFPPNSLASLILACLDFHKGTRPTPANMLNHAYFSNRHEGNHPQTANTSFKLGKHHTFRKDYFYHS
ncbi:hypothetical protein T439DRAFT_373730 [Meredithblackwellia eburnea MCA 4105]